MSPLPPGCVTRRGDGAAEAQHRSRVWSGLNQVVPDGPFDGKNPFLALQLEGASPAPLLLARPAGSASALVATPALLGYRIKTSHAGNASKFC